MLYEVTQTVERLYRAVVEAASPEEAKDLLHRLTEGEAGVEAKRVLVLERSRRITMNETHLLGRRD